MSGLVRAGYAVDYRSVGHPRPGDLLVIWNRYGANDLLGRKYEAAGAVVIVAENGYLPGPGGGKTFALARSQHNGCGWWPTPDGRERWRALECELQPWRLDGGDLLILPQRGIGPTGIAMPRQWGEQIASRLSALGHHVRLRPHPGNASARVPLERDLRATHAAVTWGSGAAVKALLSGVPVFHALPDWIGAPAATPLTWPLSVSDRFTGDRLPMFERLACAQWSPDEVASGEPFARLAANEN